MDPSHQTAPHRHDSTATTARPDEHGYAHLTGHLRQRGLECSVEYGLSDYIVCAELPDGSSLIISPPQEPPADHPPGHPESWLAIRERPDTGLHELIYNSEPGGADARHAGSVSSLFAAVDECLARLDGSLGAEAASPRVSAARTRSPTAQQVTLVPPPETPAAPPALSPPRTSTVQSR